MRQHSARQGSGGNDDISRVGLFEDRYGRGALDRLVHLLQQPCLSFAAIATEFGVTRERVRQWHLRLLPEAPQGRARRRLCCELRRRRKVMTDPLLSAFYRHARAHFGAGHVALVRATDGFRRRTARIDGRLVALHDASESTGRIRQSARRWRDADFLYLRLTDEAFVFLPTTLARAARGHTAREWALAYARYRNTFEAFHAPPHPPLADVASQDLKVSP
ncbi:MAG: hypothetical protein ACRD2X_01615 [Vicinamibacteraceae bacterium]